MRVISMNWNPLMFSYRKYPNSKLATTVSGMCSCMQRVFILYFIGISLFLIFDDVENWGEALVADIVLFLSWLLLKLKKNKWAETIAKKQETIDKTNIDNNR